MIIREAERQYRRGAVVNLLWHACPPTTGKPCQWDPDLLNAPLTDAQWQALTTPGTPLNQAWPARLDDVPQYLQYLKDKQVEVLFRPLHEMNQSNCRWGGGLARKAPPGSTGLPTTTSLAPKA